MAEQALDRLCRQFGLDPEAAQRAAGTRPEMPWYLRAAAGIGAWATAAALIAAVALILAEMLDGEALPLTAAVSGAVLAAAGSVLHRRSRGEFATQLAVAAALAGQALLVGGLGAETESLTAAAAVAAASAALLIAVIRDPELRFLTTALAVGVAFAALLEREVPEPAGILAALTLPAALVLLLRPPAGCALRSVALALLLAPMAAMLVPEAGGFGSGWLPRAAYALGLLAVLALARRTTPATATAAMAAGAASALLAGVVAAPGITAAMLLLALAYLLGSRMLAALGAVAQAWFLSRFYYDLDLTLLQKSGTLAAVGALLLGLWWIWRRPAGAEVDNG